MFNFLLILIFIRPFISSLAFPFLNSAASILIIISSFVWFFYKGVAIRRIEPLKYPLSLFCLALFIAVVFSTDKLSSFKELYKYISAILLFLVAATLSYEDKMRLVRTLVLAGFIISLLAIYQYFFGFRHILGYASDNNISSSFALDYIQRKRVFFPFVTPNTLAGYLIMIIPLALIGKKSIWLLLPLSFALLLTKSLGACLTLFLGLGIYFYLQGKLGKRKTLLLFCILTTIGLVFLARASTQKEYLQPGFSTVMRLQYWKEALEVIRTKPITGVGLGNFNILSSRYAHNSYLQLWAEMGILGVVSFLWLAIAIFRNALKNIKGSAVKSELTGLIASGAVFLIHNFVDFSFFLPEVNFIWWLTAGIIYSI